MSTKQQLCWTNTVISTYYVQGAVLGAGNTVVTRTGFASKAAIEQWQIPWESEKLGLRDLGQRLLVFYVKKSSSCLSPPTRRWMLLCATNCLRSEAVPRPLPGAYRYSVSVGWAENKWVNATINTWRSKKKSHGKYFEWLRVKIQCIRTGGTQLKRYLEGNV